MDSMHGIFTYIHHKNQPNVGIYIPYNPMGLKPGVKKNLFGTRRCVASPGMAGGGGDFSDY